MMSYHKSDSFFKIKTLEATMLKKIKQWIWARKFFFLSVLSFFLMIHYCAGYYSQKKELAVYKAKYEAVAGLFKPMAAACPKSSKCPSPQASPVPPSVPRLAPVSYGPPAPKETVPDYRDALAEAAEAAENAKADALKEEALPSPANQPAPQANPANNRRNERGRLKPLPPISKGNGSRVRVIHIKVPSWIE